MLRSEYTNKYMRTTKIRFEFQLFNQVDTDQSVVCIQKL